MATDAGTTPSRSTSANNGCCRSSKRVSRNRLRDIASGQGQLRIDAHINAHLYKRGSRIEKNPHERAQGVIGVAPSCSSYNLSIFIYRLIYTGI